jgi:putative integral membrane protein (TIGR02587 family)
VVDDLVRGVAGGMLFGIPLLYTMEVWWIGAATTATNMAVVLLFTLAAALLLVRTAGFHRTSEMRSSDVFVGAVEAVALGVVSATVVLVLLREITSETPFAAALGKIIYEAAPFAIGVAVARHVFNRSRDESDEKSGRSTDRDGVRGTVADLGATFIGALFIAFNIAPTAEIPMLAAASSPLALLAVMGASLVISYGIVFEAGFGDQKKRREQRGVLQHPATETMAAYLVALAGAALMLMFFRNVQPGDPSPQLISHVVLLGLPAAVGGAAGRLAV